MLVNVRVVLMGWVAAVFFAGGGLREAQAGNPTNGLRIEVISAYNFVVDSNVESPSTYAPRAAYLGAKVCNDGTNVLTNVVAYIGNFSGIGSTNTPGIYPARTNPPLVGPLPGGAFALTHEGGVAGTADATRYLGTLAPGECAVVYWLVSYPNVDVNGDAVWGPSVKPGDDLWLEYDIWASGQRNNTPVTADETRRVTMRNEISAMANKIFPNTANKVPQQYQDLLQLYAPSWTNTASDGTPGTVIATEGVWYDLGNVGAGFDNNGDLVPDRNAWLQPIGDPTLFDPSCFRLVNTKILLVVKLNSGPDLVYVVENQLYFENLPANNIGAVGYVLYEFQVLRGGCSSTLTPYQEVASGFDNEKFNGDYGASLGQLSSGTSRVDLAKSVNLAQAHPGQVLSYTISFTNNGQVAVGSPGAGLPLVIQDRIPTGTTYVAGSAAASNTLPAGVGSYSLLFSTNFGLSWSSVEPVPATNVTDVQWWLSDALPTGTSGRVAFQVTIRNPYPSGSLFVLNEAGLSFGTAAPFLYDDAQTILLGSNSLSGRVYFDTGTGGGIYGNGVRDGTEGGISNMLLTLYYDVNGSGLFDSGDLLLYTTNSATTNGTYAFAGLPDGNYVVVVDRTDPDLPVGHTPTSPLQLAAALDPAGVNPNAVAATNLNFGFAPVLDMAKTGPTTASEAGLATYTITLTNRFFSTGSDAGTNVYLTIYPTNLQSFFQAGATLFENATNAIGVPDGANATATVNQSTFYIGPHGYTAPSNSYRITNVLMVVPYVEGSSASPDLFITKIYGSTNTSSLVYSNQFLATNTVTLTGVFTQNVWSAFGTNWNWSRFNPANSNLFLELDYIRNPNNNAGAANRSFAIDSAYFIVQTDGFTGGATTNTTLNPVPLYDYYDTNILQFVSATPPVSLSDANGPAPNSGRLFWSNLGPLYPGGSTSVTATFRLLGPTNDVTRITTNTAVATNVFFANGVPANSVTSRVATTVRPTAALGDFIWRDLNANGVQDGGAETGIAGVSVRLTPPAGVNLGNGPGNPVTNGTDASGAYLFTGLPSNGVYTVTVLTNTLPGGAGSNTYDEDNGTVSPNNQTLVTISNLADHRTADFGYNNLLSQISGSIWHDVNRNGAVSPDTGEPYLTNITVRLFDSSGTLVATTTATNGLFNFFGAYSGTYTVRVDNATGSLGAGTWTPSYDSDGTSTTHNVAVTLPLGGLGTANYSYFQSGAFGIGDTIFYDWNGNGTQQGSDEGITNVAVRLYWDINTNGVYDVGLDPLVGTNITASDGTYLFGGLSSNRYIVIVDHFSPGFPGSYTITADPQGALDGRSVVIITNANNLLQDFGYQPTGAGSIGDRVWRDVNANGIQSGVLETGISNVTVTLQVDFNGDNTYVTVTSLVTGATGAYLFSNLPDGAYRVIVDVNDPDLPVDAFGDPWFPTTPVQYDVVISGGSSYLDADFGFAALGAIGDTIFWDSNQNGTQDFTEPGVSGATVRLYLDVNSNGLYDVGTDTLQTSANTASNGTYLFSALPPNRYVVVVAQTGILAGAALSADPSADGEPCSSTNAVGCDGAFGVNILPGTSFMGADFGYVPPGVIGDTLWIDFNTNGVRDLGETGIPYVSIDLYTNGTLVATTETDANGEYVFSLLADGVYRVVVRTNDVDFPAGLSQVYDPDAALNHQATNVVLAGGVVTSIGGQGCTNCSLNVDFGYRYAGTNVLSGTVGLDGLPYDGLLGAGPSGVGTNEAPFAGVSVYAYLWNDDGDNVLEPGETVLVDSTLTATNGDYQFGGLPAGDGNDRYIVSLAAPQAELLLTTTNGSTPALSVVSTTNVSGFSVSAYQVVAIAPVVTNIDFAFILGVPYDFGDLPDTYDTTLASDGARHRLAASPTLYLGATVDNEPNGQPSAGATGDGADEDGVGITGAWVDGQTNAIFRTQVGAGSGWLLGFVDWNGNGVFTDVGELVINQAVTTNGGNGSGLYTNRVAVPAGTIDASNVTAIAARFRLFASEPPFPAFGWYGAADNGEVEDYLFSLGTIGDLVWVDANSDGLQDGGEPPIPGVRVFIDVNGDGQYQAGEPSGITDAAGLYSIGGLAAGTYDVRVDTNTFPSELSPVSDLDGVGTAHRASVVLTNGQQRADVDFGYLGTSVIGDFVWRDVNTNGVQDVLEPGVSGVTVRLYDAASNLLASTLTDGGGAYVFSNLYAATYFIGFVEPSGWVFTTPNLGTAETGSDADPITGFTALITLTNNQSDLRWDAGLIRLTNPSYDLSKTLNQPTNRPVAVGEEVVFLLAVTNSGDVAFTTVRLDDVYDTNAIAFVSADPGADAQGPGSVTWSNLGPLAVGNVAVVTARFTAVASTLPGFTTNEARATIVTVDSDVLGAKTSSVPAQVVNPLLGVLKTKVTPAGIAVTGDVVVFHLTVTNAGDVAFDNVSLDDLFDPARLAHLDSAPAADTVAPGLLQWTNLGPLSIGGSFVVTTRFTAVSSGTGTNVAVGSATLTNGLPVPPVTSSVPHAAMAPAIAVVKTVNGANLVVGTNNTPLLYAFVVSNAGDVALTNVVVDDAALGFATNLGTLAVGQVATVEVASVLSTDLTNTVTATGEDPNGDERTDDDTAEVDLRTPGLRLVKTAGPAADGADHLISAGSDVVYTFTVFNTGDTHIASLVVTDNVLGVVGTLAGPVAPGSTNVFQFTASNLLASVTNIAVVTGEPSDAGGTPLPGFDPVDDSDDAVVLVTPVADLELTKTADQATPSVGNNLLYTITVTNRGPSAATGVVVEDVLPAGVAYVAHTNGAYVPGTGLWTIGNLAVGHVTNLEITVLVTNSGSIANTAQVQAGNEVDEDSTPDNDDSGEDDQDTVTVTVPNAIDLELTKTVSDTTPNVGSNIVYTLTLTNKGPDNATGVTVTDVLPAGVSYVGHTGPGTYTATNGVWTLGGPMTPGASRVLAITVTVTQSGSITNVAQVQTADQGDVDSTPGNDDPAEDDLDDVVINVPPAADLELTKTVDDATPNVFDDVTFTITVTNRGPDAATGVTVLDALPAGLAYVSHGGGTYDSTTGVWSIGGLAVGSATSLQVTATVTNSGVIENSARVESANEFDVDSTPGNDVPGEDDQDSATLTVPVSGDLELDKSVDDSTPNLGSTIVYTLTVTNRGPDAQTLVTVYDVLPSGVAHLSHTGGVYDVGAGLWSIGSLPAGSVTSLQIAATVTNTGVMTNYAEIRTAAYYDPDSTPSNAPPFVEDDDDEVVISVPASADLELDKSVDDGSPALFDSVTFTIVVTNRGPDAATGVTVADVLPAGLAYVSDSGGYDTNTGVWTIGALPANGSTGLLVTAQVIGTGAITNEAQVETANEFDPDSTPGNDMPAEDDQDGAVVAVGAAADLELEKTVDNSAPNVGQTVVFTITVTNRGPDAATGVAVSDVLPGGLSYASHSGGAYDTNTSVWTIGDLAVGSVTTLQMTANVDVAGVFTNIAQVSAVDQYDTDSTPGNDDPAEDDQDDAAISTPISDLELRKSVNDATPNVTDLVTFTITVTNRGPDAATGVAVEDVLPSGLAYASHSGGAYDSTTGVWAIGSLAVGSTTSLQITATVTNSGVIENIAQVSAADQFDPDSTPGNDTDTEDDQDNAVLTVPSASDLSLVKSVNTPSTVAGSNVVFSLVLSNAGPNIATGITVRDVLPSGLAYVSHSGGTYATNTGLWSIPSLGVGSNRTLTITATVTVDGTFTNVAQVQSSDQFDPDSTPGNEDGTPYEDDEDDAVVTATALIDLELAKTVNLAQADPFQNVTWTVTLTNRGPSTATGVTVFDPLPANWVYVSDSSGAYDTNTFLWNVGTVPSGGSTQLQLVAYATLGLNLTGHGPVPPAYTNQAQVWTANETDVDSTPGNSVGSEDDQAEAYIPVRAHSDLALQKSVDDATPNLGQQVAFTLVLTNEGPQIAVGVRVEDVLPAGLTYVSNSAGAAYSELTGIWDVGPVLQGTATSLVVYVEVATTGVLTNRAQVNRNFHFDVDSTPDNDVASEDDQDEVALNVPPAADLSLTKSVDSSLVVTGQTVVFSLVVSNAGPDAATGVAVEDALPGGFSYVSHTGGSYDTNSSAWTVGSLAVGSTTSLQVTARAEASGVWTNVAQVSAANEFDIDSTPGNDAPAEDDQDDAVVTIIAPAISVAKTANGVELLQGTNNTPVTYAFEVTNSGDVALTNVVVSDAALGFTTNVGTLAAGQVITVQVTTVISADLTNIVTVTGYPPAGDPRTNSDPAEVDLITPTITIDNTVNGLELVQGTNDTPVTYAFVVSNTGDVTLTNVVVTNAALGFTTNVGTLAVGQSVTVEVVSVISADLLNSAVATGQDPVGGTVTDDDPSEVDLIAPAISVAKQVNGVDVYQGTNGASLVYTFVVENEGDVALTNVVVDDVLLGFSTNLGTLASGASVTVEVAGALSGSLTNTVIATGEDPVGGSHTDQSEAIVLLIAPGISVEKTVNGADIAQGTNNTPVTYAFVVSNIGDVALTNVVVDDPLLSFTTNVGTLAVGQSVTVEVASVISGDLTNTVTATGEDPNGDEWVDEDTAEVDLIAPGLAVAKTVNGTEFAQGTNGTPVTYAFVVSNIGDVALTNVVLDDTLLSFTTNVGTLTVGQSVTVAVASVISDDLTNTVVATGEDPVGGEWTDDDTASVGVLMAIRGSVFEDVDGDGAFDTEDTNGLVGVTVTLLDATNGVVAVTTTDANGGYSFTNLPSGSYTVVESDPPGYASTADTAGANDNEIPVTLSGGSDSSGNDFLDTAYGVIGNFVWLDLNGDGLQDGAGETGMPDVVVNLYDTNGVVVATTTTSVSGAYAFTNVLPGFHVIGFELPAGYQYAPRDVGIDDELDSDADLVTGLTATSQLFSGQSDLSRDAGVYLPASLGGTVFEDLDYNSVLNPGELTIPTTGLVVNLYRSDNTFVTSTVTDASSVYLFTNLPPGAYIVEFIKATNFVFVTPLEGGDPLLDSDAVQTNGRTVAITLVSGQSDLTRGAGLARFGALGDFVWWDLNNDGEHNENLAFYGQNGVRVRLFRVAGGVTSLVNTVVTSSNTNGARGAYFFPGLEFGDYIVQVETNDLPNFLKRRTTVTRYTVTISPLYTFFDADFGFNTDPTPVTLKTFTATREGAGVQLAWETASEFENLGFHLYRAASAEGPRTRLTGELIPGQGTGEGGAYAFTDESAPSDITWFYWLEDVSWSFEGKLHGPVVVRADEPAQDERVATFEVDATEAGLHRITYEALVAAGLPAASLETARIKVFLDGEEVAIATYANGATLKPGNSLLFYVPAGVGPVACELQTGADALRMGWAYAAPKDEGELWTGSVQTDGQLPFTVTHEWQRYLLMGFEEGGALVLDVTDARRPVILFGHATLHLPGQSGVYLSHDAALPAQCIAVQHDAVRVVRDLKKP